MVQTATTTFTQDQISKIRELVKDKYSVGSFSGMIFNRLVENPDETIDELIKRAIKVRLRLEELAK